MKRSKAPRRVPPQGDFAEEQQVTSFTLATNYAWQDEAVEYHDIQAWGKVAEIIASYCKAGSKVYVEGRLRSRVVKRRATRTVEIVADNLIMLGHRHPPP